MFGVRSARALAIVSVVVVAFAACGDDGGTPIFDTTGGTTTSAGGDSTDTTGSGGNATTTTTTTVPEDGFTFIDTFEFDPNPPAPDVAVGAADFAAAAALTDEFVAGGVDVSGIEVWVFDVVGSSDRLLVMEADASAESAASDPEGGDFFEILRSSPTVAEAGITRLVINYRDSDEDGPYVFTMTLPLAEMLAMGEDGDITTIAEIQVTRG